MAKKTDQTKPFSEIYQRRINNSQKPDKFPAWSAMKSLFSLRRHHSDLHQTPKPVLEEQRTETRTRTQTQTQKLQEQRKDQMKQMQKERSEQKAETETLKQKQGVQEQRTDQKTETQTQKQKQKPQKQKIKQKTQTETQKPKQRPQEQKLNQKTQTQTQKHKQNPPETAIEDKFKKFKIMRCSGSLCNNTKIIQKPETSLHLSNLGVSSSSTKSANSSSSPSSGSSGRIRGSPRTMPFRRFHGCYECRIVVDPVLGITREPSLRSAICSCSDCGEIFMDAENLELHQSVKHAVSELGPGDSSKNIVEIIFKSSWMKKNQTPICNIDRILKVNNTQTTISNFERYRDAIKSKSTKKINPRCVADGNELLRFHCAAVACPLGRGGSTALCNSSTRRCDACRIIKDGISVDGVNMGILTMATSGRAHDRDGGRDRDRDGGGGEGKRAMLVCRVIAGRVKMCADKNSGVDFNNVGNDGEEYDSVVGKAGDYSNLDELYVFNPKAILPCFVVIYNQ